MTDGLLFYRDPNDGQFYPIVVGSDAAVTEHEAAPNPHDQYLEKADTGYVRSDGDTMSGNLTVSRGDATSSQVVANGDGSTGYGEFALYRNDIPRWLTRTGNNASDTLTTGTGGIGADWQLISRNDDGSSRAAVLSFNRSTGVGTFAVQPTVSGAENDLVLASGWADYGGAYAGAYATRFGDLVTVEGLLKRTSDLAVTIGGAYLMATIPSGFLPIRTVMAAGINSGLSPSQTACRLNVGATGIFLVSLGSGTMATGSWVGFSVSYRAA